MRRKPIVSSVTTKLRFQYRSRVGGGGDIQCHPSHDVAARCDQGFTESWRHWFFLLKNEFRTPPPPITLPPPPHHINIIFFTISHCTCIIAHVLLHMYYCTCIFYCICIFIAHVLLHIYYCTCIIAQWSLLIKTTNFTR